MSSWPVMSTNCHLGPGRRFDPRGFSGKLLRGWELAGVVTFQSGLPLSRHPGNEFQCFCRLRDTKAEPSSQPGVAQ